jgi:hypothetical protein
MALTLAEIRAKLQASESRSQGNNQSNGGDNTVYAHWNIAEGTTARIRFLPDANPKNNFFWVERAMIRLPFAGIKGQSDSKPVVVQVPCVEMYNDGSACPILAEVRAWFKDPALEEMGRKYWKKRSYLFQGFVRENPIGDDRTPENPIRRFVISPQIFNLVKNALLDPEMENMPTDYQAGLDFTVKKTSKGGYADYSTSSWARKESALTSVEADAIEQFGLYNLNDFLPNKPSDVELKVIKEMFEASVDGQPYDPDRWAAYYKPSGFQGGASNESAPRAAAPAAAPAAPAPAAQHDDPPFEPDEDTPVASAPVAAPAAAKPSSQKAEDILAMIRNRQK